MPRRKPPLLEGALAERTTVDGRRRIQLNQDERDAALHSQMIEGAVALYLDVGGRHTNAEIAEELGISVHQLKNLTCTEEFENCWNDHAADLGRDPRLKATQNAILDLLGSAVYALKEVLEGGSANAKVQAAKMIFDLNGIVKQEMTKSNKKELIDFLTGKSVTISQTNVQVGVPEEYSEALDQYDRAMEGEFREIDNDSDVGNEDNKTQE